ncbi:MAG TPA: hypothetical protein VER79_14710 [Candidatus Limnocylindrales bacterium]|nr:hypothetical protein [Candidatus Limnocylindrales bacterium]
MTFHLPVNLLAYLNPAEKPVVSPGEVQVMVGTSSADLPLRGSFTITGVETPVQRVFETHVTVG